MSHALSIVVLASIVMFSFMLDLGLVLAVIYLIHPP